MTLKDLYETYKLGIGQQKRIILADQQTGNGWEIKNIEQFESILNYYGDDDLHLINQNENDDIIYFEFFIMQQDDPKIAIIHHPPLTNAYFKDAPDRIIDMTSINNNIYRYISIDYGNLLKDVVIELPSQIDDNVFKFLKSKFPTVFINNIKNTESSFSIVFTTTDRFKNAQDFSFKIFPLESLYQLKSPTIKNVSAKLWKELKARNK
jgi:hypothetical protein